MENQSNSSQSCNCGDGCCTPQKSPLWKKIIFVMIILAAGAIVTVKLVAKDKAPTAKCCATPANASCCEKPATAPCCAQPAMSKDKAE